VSFAKKHMKALKTKDGTALQLQAIKSQNCAISDTMAQFVGERRNGCGAVESRFTTKKLMNKT
jgi:hypothetical protein